MFAKFGEIASAHVQRGMTEDKLKDSGFVSFKESEAAVKAVEAMNKKRNEDGSFLIVF